MIVIMEYKTKSDHETRDPHSVLENLENRGIDIHGATMKVKRATALIRPVIPIMKQQMEGKTDMKMIAYASYSKKSRKLSLRQLKHKMYAQITIVNL